MLNDQALIAIGKQTIAIEHQAVGQLLDRLDQDFADACQLILNCRSRVVVTGMGKSGHIARKIAATLASTGTPALFVHPAEASHGDLGMITDQDALIAISNSGKTPELLVILPLLKRKGTPLIAMTGNCQSELAKTADVHLDVRVDKEACPLDLAPTSSTTVSLVMGDALAIALLQARGFTEQDFALSHPGGSLGKRLLLKVRDIMHQGEAIPMVTEDTKLLDALVEMTQKGFGMTAVVDENRVLQGVFTDGDLRRSLDQNINMQTVRIKAVMTRNSKTIAADEMASKAAYLMETNKVYALLVTNDQQQVVGALKMHDLLQAGVV